jgi:hypothetical protein
MIRLGLSVYLLGGTICAQDRGPADLLKMPVAQGTNPSTRLSSASNLPALAVAFQIAEVFGVPLEAVFQYEKRTGSTT